MHVCVCARAFIHRYNIYIPDVPLCGFPFLITISVIGVELSEHVWTCLSKCKADCILHIWMLKNLILSYYCSEPWSFTVTGTGLDSRVMRTYISIHLSIQLYVYTYHLYLDCLNWFFCFIRHHESLPLYIVKLSESMFMIYVNIWIYVFVCATDTSMSASILVLFQYHINLPGNQPCFAGKSMKIHNFFSFNKASRIFIPMTPAAQDQVATTGSLSSMWDIRALLSAFPELEEVSLVKIDAAAGIWEVFGMAETLAKHWGVFGRELPTWITWILGEFGDVSNWVSGMHAQWSCQGWFAKRWGEL